MMNSSYLSNFVKHLRDGEEFTVQHFSRDCVRVKFRTMIFYMNVEEFITSILYSYIHVED